MQSCSDFRLNNQESAIETYGSELLREYFLDVGRKLNERHTVTKVKLQATVKEVDELKGALETERQELSETLHEWEDTEEQLKAAKELLVEFEARNQELQDTNSKLEETVKTLRSTINKAAKNPHDSSRGGYKRQDGPYSPRGRRGDRGIGKSPNNKAVKTHHHYEIKAAVPDVATADPDTPVTLSAAHSSSGSTPEKRSVHWGPTVKSDSTSENFQFGHMTGQAKTSSNEEQGSMFHNQPAVAPSMDTMGFVVQQKRIMLNNPFGDSKFSTNPFERNVAPPPGFPGALGVQPLSSSSPWDNLPSENHSEWNRMGFFGFGSTYNSADMEQKSPPDNGSGFV